MKLLESDPKVNATFNVSRLISLFIWYDKLDNYVKPKRFQWLIIYESKRRKKYNVPVIYLQFLVGPFSPVLSIHGFGLYETGIHLKLSKSILCSVLYRKYSNILRRLTLVNRKELPRLNSPPSTRTLFQSWYPLPKTRSQSPYQPIRFKNSPTIRTEFGPNSRVMNLYRFL